MSAPQIDPVQAGSDFAVALTGQPSRGWIANIPTRFRREVSSGAYRPEIDGLRFFAIAIVVFGHAVQRGDRFFPTFGAFIDNNPALQLIRIGPGLGVYLFFAISGFIIATQARKAKLPPLSVGFLKAYFGRRVLRIEPPYMILLVVSWLALTVTGYQPEGTKQFFTQPESLNLSLLGSLFYAHDLIWGAFPRLFPPGWTLEVEVQFYIAAPILFSLWFRLKETKERVFFGVVVLLASALVSTCTPHQVGPVFVYYSILRFFSMFWLGIVIADLRTWIIAQTETLPAAAITALGWLGLLDFVLLPDIEDSLATGLPVRFALYASVAAMFVSALASRSGFRRFCARPWIALIGGACYSIYLVHMQLLQAMTLIASKLTHGLSFSAVACVLAFEVAAVIGAGLMFYIMIERPFMRPSWHLRLMERFGLRSRALTPERKKSSSVEAAVAAPTSSRRKAA
jgi:peptidoglycan/LPS O-acetylase OafA/YrhL